VPVEIVETIVRRMQMFVKIQDDHRNDKQIMELERAVWKNHEAGDDFVVLQCYPLLDDEFHGIQVRLYHGDRVFFMDNDGQTIDSKRVLVPGVCPVCGGRKTVGQTTCTRCSGTGKGA